MASTIGAYEAKTRFSELLRRVQQGETVTITRHGMPVAVLAPPQPASHRSVAEVVAEMKELRKRLTLGGIPLRELIEEGRRY